MKKVETLGIGLMAYSLFLGAGNIIYPPMLGIESGSNFFSSMLGFLITSVGLPAIVLLVMSKFKSENVLTSFISPSLSVLFWVSLYLSIGPAFGMPRAVNIAYEIGIQSLFPSVNLTVFSIVFLLIVMLFSFRLENLINIIGKVITPLIILMIFSFTFYAVINPAEVQAEPSNKFRNNPFISGLLEGYMTMDVLAAVGFGIVILNKIRSHYRIDEPVYRKAVISSLLVYMALMSLTYLSLAYIGLSSYSILSHVSNGIDLLTQYSDFSLGNYGKVIFSLIVLLACFTTLVGLASACGQFAFKTWGINYKLVSFSVIVMTFIPANFGLDKIIQFSLPVILVLCPIAMILLIGCMFSEKKKTFGTTNLVLFGGACALLDTANILGYINDQYFLKVIRHYNPLFDYHLSWLIPVFIYISIKLTYRIFIWKKNTDNLN